MRVIAPVLTIYPLNYLSVQTKFSFPNPLKNLPLTETKPDPDSSAIVEPILIDNSPMLFTNDSPLPTIEDAPWGWWRSQMPIAEKWTYFDHAAVAPLPRQTAEAIAAYADEAMRDGDTRWPQWAEENERLRSGFAKWLTCDPAEIALIPNTSFGINVVAEGIQWQPGDNIVLPAGEFPSNRFPWLNQGRHGVEVRIIGDDWINLRHR